MRSGRLRIVSDGTPLGTRFVVMPDDGSEPIELRVSKARVRGRPLDAVRFVIAGFADSLDLTDLLTGEHLKANGAHGTPALYRDVEIDDSAGDVDRFSWRFDADGSLPQLELHHLNFEAIA